MPVVTVHDSLDILHAKSMPIISEDYKETFKEMKDILKPKNQNDSCNGLGLALPQMGINKRGFIFKCGDHYETAVNPEIIMIDRSKGSKVYIEGCLSIPGEWYAVTRWKSIFVRYDDHNGKIKPITLNGRDAEVFQHELDHLNGILISDIGKKIEESA